MTEQTVETEQQFLGNDPKPARLEDAILKTFLGKPLDDGQRSVLDKVVQSYVPNAHRITAHPIAELAQAERSPLAAKFLGAIDAAFDKADHSLAGRVTAVLTHSPDADALFRKSVAAAAKLVQARTAAKNAEDKLAESEDTLSNALAVENLAEIDSFEADRVLFEFIREVAAQ